VVCTERAKTVDPFFFGAVFAIAFACGGFIMAVACIKPEGTDTPEAVDVDGSHPLEAPAQ
jgi:hypothetical protein